MVVVVVMVVVVAVVIEVAAAVAVAVAVVCLCSIVATNPLLLDCVEEETAILHDDDQHGSTFPERHDELVVLPLQFDGPVVVVTVLECQ